MLAGEGGTVDDDGGRDCGIIGVIKVDLAVLATAGSRGTPPTPS